LLGAVASVVAWSVPFVTLVGVHQLVALASAHFVGHMTVWGRTALAEPGPARIADFVRDVVIDGMGGGQDALGMAIVGLGTAVVSLGAVAVARRNDFAVVRNGLLLVAPYTVWIVFGQNLAEAPRHALPCVVALVLLIAITVVQPSSSSMPKRLLLVFGAALATAMLARAALDTFGRATIPPAGAALVDWVRATIATSTPREQHQPATRIPVAVFGGRSVRYFELSELSSLGHPAGSLGDVQVALGHFPALPARIFVTSELDLAAPSYPLVPVATFCRPPRLDRRAPCLELYEAQMLRR
jgi:hypothetical protein